MLLQPPSEEPVLISMNVQLLFKRSKMIFVAATLQAMEPRVSGAWNICHSKPQQFIPSHIDMKPKKTIERMLVCFYTIVAPVLYQSEWSTRCTLRGRSFYAIQVPPIQMRNVRMVGFAEKHNVVFY